MTVKRVRSVVESWPFGVDDMGPNSRIQICLYCGFDAERRPPLDDRIFRSPLTVISDQSLYLFSLILSVIIVS